MSVIAKGHARRNWRVWLAGSVMAGILLSLAPLLWWYSPALDFYQGSFAVWRPTHENVVSVEFTQDSKTLVSLGLDGRVRLWDCEFWKERPFDLGMKSKATICRLSPDGKQLAVCDEDDSVVLVDLATRQSTSVFNTPQKTFIDGFQFSADGRRLVMHSGQHLKYMVLSISEKVVIAEVSVDGFNYGNFTLHPNGQTILAHPTTERGVREYDWRTGRLVRTFANEDDRLATWIGASVITPDHKSVLTTSWKSAGVAEWDLATGELKRFVKAHQYGASCNNLAITKDGSMMVTAQELGNMSAPSQMRVWSMKDFSLIRTYSSPRPSTRRQDDLNFNCLAISPNQQLLASGHKGGWISVRKMPRAP